MDVQNGQRWSDDGGGWAFWFKDMGFKTLSRLQNRLRQKQSNSHVATSSINILNTCQLQRCRKHKRGSTGTKKKKKETDMTTAKLRAASKFVGQTKILSAHMTDTSNKLQARLSYACYVMLCYVMLRYVMLSYVMLCYVCLMLVCFVLKLSVCCFFHSWQAWMQANAEMVAKAKELRSKGVTEDRLMKETEVPRPSLVWFDFCDIRFRNSGKIKIKIKTKVRIIFMSCHHVIISSQSIFRISESYVLFSFSKHWDISLRYARCSTWRTMPVWSRWFTQFSQGAIWSIFWAWECLKWTFQKRWIPTWTLKIWSTGSRRTSRLTGSSVNKQPIRLPGGSWVNLKLSMPRAKPQRRSQTKRRIWLRASKTPKL